MKTETVQFELPKEVMESAERIGFTREKLAEMSKSFTILEVLAATSKLDKTQARAISQKIKASAWKKTKRKLGL
jgi:G:T/U-mismatch repair DNA glycosylase